MSKISLIHDAIYTLLGTTLFPTKLELSDALILDNNPDLVKSNGYGASFEEATNTERFTSCQFSIARNVNIVLTKEVYASQSDNSAFKVAEKELLEDQYALLNEMEKNDTIDSLVINRKYLNDSGLQRLLDSDGYKQFLVINTTFEIEYTENFI